MTRNEYKESISKVMTIGIIVLASIYAPNDLSLRSRARVKWYLLLRGHQPADFLSRWVETMKNLKEEVEFESRG